MRNALFLSLFAAIAATAQVSGPIVTSSSAMAVSQPMETLAQMEPANLYRGIGGYVERSHSIPRIPSETKGFVPAPLVSVPANTPYNQTANYQPLGAAISANFDGLGLGTPSFAITGAPPDTTMGVSPTQIVQWVNSQYAVFDKLGNKLLGGTGFLPGNAIWATLPAGSLCRDFNRGDPMVQYDRIADRWILSQFAFNNGFTLNAQCFAVSTTNNALGTYNLYQFDFGNVLPDYAKIGVWPDAYYTTYNMFTTGSSFAGGRACAYDRAQMLLGNVATSVCFNSTTRFAYLPSDFDGTTPPPVGTPNYHISWDWDFTTTAPYTMQLTKFVPNFLVPANSTFTDGFGGAVFSFVAFPLDANTIAPCNDSPDACAPQLGTTQKLDTLGDRHMYRLVYRNFGTHDALLFTQSVDINPAAVAAQLRWWEIRNPGANPPVVYQNSTYNPNATYRWMGSAAFDKLGNIGIGFSASSATMNPAIRIAGRRRTDPINLLRTEQTVIAGTGSQGVASSLSRWGDYSAMQIDPSDDCTFWYTTQYIGATGTFNWRTRIASFKFPNCN